MNKPTYTIDGATFSTLDEFAEQFSAVVLQGHRWHGDLNAFEDILAGGMGSPDGGFILRWENSALSRQRLGHPNQTVQWFEERLANCDPSNTTLYEQKLADAKRKWGETLFDMLVAIMQSHGPGGDEAEDGVELLLL